MAAGSNLKLSGSARDGLVAASGLVPLPRSRECGSAAVWRDADIATGSVLLVLAQRPRMLTVGLDGPMR